MPTASGDCQSLRDLSIFFFFVFIIDFNWEGATMPNFVYLNVKCAQDVNMEIFKEQVLSFHPSTVACWSCPDASTPSPRRRRRFAKFLFDSKHLHKTQSILLRSFRLPVQLNPIWFAIRFVIFEEKKKIIHSIYVCMPILKYKIFEKEGEGEREGAQKEAKLFTSKWRAWNLWEKCCRCVPYCT